MQFVSLASTNQAGSSSSKNITKPIGGYVARQLRHCVRLRHLFLRHCRWEVGGGGLSCGGGPSVLPNRDLLHAGIRSVVVSNTCDYFIITARRCALHLLILSGGDLVLPATFVSRTFLPICGSPPSPERSCSPPIALLRTSVFSHGRAHLAVQTSRRAFFFAPP